MKIFLIGFVTLIVLIFAILFWLIFIGIPQSKIENHSVISMDNLVNGVSVSFCENEVQIPYYHYGYNYSTYSVSRSYYLKKAINNEIEYLDIFPSGFRVQDAVYFQKIKRWVVLLYPDNHEGDTMDRHKVYVFVFSKKSNISKSSFVCYNREEKKGIDYEIDSVNERIKYYDKDFKLQTLNPD